MDTPHFTLCERCSPPLDKCIILIGLVIVVLSLYQKCNFEILENPSLTQRAVLSEQFSDDLKTQQDQQDTMHDRQLGSQNRCIYILYKHVKFS